MNGSMKTALRVDVLGLGVLGPGMNDAAAALAALADPSAWTSSPTVIPPPTRLPPAERRRAGAIVKLGLSVADAAVMASGLDPATLPTVFTAASGDGANLHAMCEVLATPERLVSPTRFSNSVHNAAAGYWHIAVASREASTSLAAHDAGFAAGLLEAASQCVHDDRPVLFVATDTPYPEPLARVRPLPDAFGVAMVLVPASWRAERDDGALAAPAADAQAAAPGDAPAPVPVATLEISLADVPADDCDDARLEALRRGIPAAHALPLLRAMARGERSTCVVEFLDGLALCVDVTPGRIPVAVSAPPPASASA
jgi:hypothetical protein